MDAQAREIIAALKAWFEGRAPREKNLLIVGGALLLAAFVYDVLWEPAFEGRAHIAASMPALEGQLLDLQAQGEVVRRLRANVAIRTLSGAALRDALAGSLADAGIAGAQLTMVGKGVQVDAKNVPFDAWMTWLDQIRRTNHMRVVNTLATGEAQPGRATVSATLQPVNEDS